MQIDFSVSSQQVGEPAAGHLSIWRVFLTAYATALAIALLDFADGRNFIGDIDDRLRELQIRHFLSAGGSWHDLSLPMIATPEPYNSPWSRLVDLPYIVITALLSPLIGAEKSLSLSLAVWPPIMLSLFSLLAAVILRPHLKASGMLNYTVIVTSLVLMIFAAWEFVPDRIDHHNSQIIGLMIMLAGLHKWHRSGGLLVGAGTLVSVVISLEGLPFIAVGFIGIILCFLFEVKGARELLFSASASILSLTVPAAIVFIGPSASLSTQCDAFSAPYILLALGFSACLMAGTLFLTGRGPFAKIVNLAGPALAVALSPALLFPSCLSGPYWMIDPLSEANWLDRVSQEFTFIYYLQHDQFSIVVMLATLTCIAIMALPSVIEEARQRNPGIAIIFAVAVTALLITLLQTRNIRFAFAFVPLFLPLALNIVALRDKPVSTGTRKFVAIAVALVVVTTTTLHFAIPPQESRDDAIDYMAHDKCPGQDFSVLSNQTAGRIALPQALALPVIFAAPEGFSVAAVPFHRASPGMKRMFELFTSPDSETRKAAAAPFDYVAVCKFPLPVDVNQAPLYAALAAGGSWPGLIRIENPVVSDFQLFRIDHSLFR